MVNKLENELKVRGLSVNTINVYLFYNNKFLEFIKKKPEDVVETDVKSYLNYLRSDLERSNRTLALVIAALECHYNNLLGRNFKIQKLKIPKPFKEGLSKDEFMKLLSGVKNLKHKLIIELIYSSGMRLDECINLRIEDLEIENSIGKVKCEGMFLILNRSLAEDLQKFIGHRTNGLVFPGRKGKMTSRAVQKLIKLAGERSNIRKHVKAHTLRYSFTKHLLEEKGDIINLNE
jgi:integrase/recombinase XerD